MKYSPEEANRVIRSLLKAAGKSEEEIARLEANAKRRLNRQLKKQQKAENERRMSQSVEFAMINADAEMKRDELLQDKSLDYRDGFIAGELFEMEVSREISNIYLNINSNQ